jgi:hypothetical protein
MDNKSPYDDPENAIPGRFYRECRGVCQAPCRKLRDVPAIFPCPTRTGTRSSLKLPSVDPARQAG